MGSVAQRVPIFLGRLLSVYTGNASNAPGDHDRFLHDTRHSHFAIARSLGHRLQEGHEWTMSGHGAGYAGAGHCRRRRSSAPRSAARGAWTASTGAAATPRGRRSRYSPAPGVSAASPPTRCPTGERLPRGGRAREGGLAPRRG
ncbi:unnamed protein product [Prorocentrum cordatum]|uniref:Uncharacterized protein n=1 Tax=Prorocentrum cordatum TaxID=2364126 RepID=A0ABN9XZA5_9DINO|nr:unnamed protein product [Polarella glacialis]